MRQRRAFQVSYCLQIHFEAHLASDNTYVLAKVIPKEKITRYPRLRLTKRQAQGFLAYLDRQDVSNIKRSFFSHASTDSCHESLARIVSLKKLMEKGKEALLGFLERETVRVGVIPANKNIDASL